MKYHYETTGSPSPLAWLLYRLPLVLPSVCRSLFLHNRSISRSVYTFAGSHSRFTRGRCWRTISSSLSCRGSFWCHSACAASSPASGSGVHGQLRLPPPRARARARSLSLSWPLSLSLMVHGQLRLPPPHTRSLSLSLSHTAHWCLWPSSPLGATTLSSTTSRLCPCSSHSTTSSSSTFSRPASCPPPPALTHLPRLTPPPPPLRWRPPSI
jgi:hypothetical protein